MRKECFLLTDNGGLFRGGVDRATVDDSAVVYQNPNLHPE